MIKEQEAPVDMGVVEAILNAPAEIKKALFELVREDGEDSND